MDWQPAAKKPSDHAGAGWRPGFAPVAGETAFSRAGFFAAQSEKRPVLPRADDLPVGTERHAGAAGRQRGMDDQRGVDMGSVAGYADCATVGAAPPFRRRLASRAHGRRHTDGFWRLDCLAIFARGRVSILLQVILS